MIFKDIEMRLKERKEMKIEGILMQDHKEIFLILKEGEEIILEDVELYVKFDEDGNGFINAGKRVRIRENKEEDVPSVNDIFYCMQDRIKLKKENDDLKKENDRLNKELKDVCERTEGFLEDMYHLETELYTILYDRDGNCGRFPKFIEETLRRYD